MQLRHWKMWAIPWIPPALLDFYRWSTNHPIVRARKNAPFILPKRSLTQLFPNIETKEIRVPVHQTVRRHPWALPMVELLQLAAVVHHTQPHRIFEIGTYTGSTTLMMAMNTPSETEIFTLDIDPAVRETHQHGYGVGGFPKFTVGSAYLDTPVAAKIQQLFLKSSSFDFRPFYGTIDLVFVDADHTYEFVKADTATAFKLLRSGGIIIWDDYLWNERSPEDSGVARCINELAQTKSVFQIDGTRFAIYIDAI